MIAITETVKNGQVILDALGERSDGACVEVLPVPATRPTLGMREEDWPTTPEGIAALLPRMDRAEPGWLSIEDDTVLRTALREQKDLEKSRFLEDAEKVLRICE